MSLISGMQERGIWSGFLTQVVGLEPALQAMSLRGMPVEPIAYGEVMKLLEGKMAEAKVLMQSLVPREIMGRTSYKRTPRIVTAAHFSVDDPTTGVKRWFKLKVWSPSNKGLIAYMVFKGHPVPKAIKTNKDTTGQIELIRLSRSTRDPMYGAVIAYRKAQTVLKNHMKNWKPGEDGRVHSTFYYDPATGQLSSRRPNTQNAPHHDDPEFGGYADDFRRMVAAKPGHLIVEFDYKSFHVQTLAFNAEDADMLRLAKLDIHSFVTAHFLRLGDAGKLIALPDDELREYLKWIKKNHAHTRNAQVKHALLGYNNGMGYNKLYKQYMEFFNNMTEAKKVMGLLDHLFPKAKAYREAICQKAHDQGYLISRHGYIRYFWEVFRWQGGKWSHGDDHEAALCFYTQNDAHGELRERIRQLYVAHLDDRYGFINNIHDSLMFEWPEKLLDELRVVRDIMETPSRVLINSICPRGLSVEAEVKAGPNWTDAKEVKL